MRVTRFLLLILISFTGTGCVITEVGVSNPIPEMSRIAVAPFVNLSSERAVDGRRFAEIYYSELQKVPGYQVIPVGVVEAAMLDNDLNLNGPEELLELTEILDVDAVVFGAVTEYSPYKPPRLGLQVSWYARESGRFWPGIPYDEQMRRQERKSIKDVQRSEREERHAQREDHRTEQKALKEKSPKQKMQKRRHARCDNPACEHCGETHLPTVRSQSPEALDAMTNFGSVAWEPVNSTTRWQGTDDKVTWIADPDPVEAETPQPVSDVPIITQTTDESRSKMIGKTDAQQNWEQALTSAMFQSTSGADSSPEMPPQPVEVMEPPQKELSRTVGPTPGSEQIAVPSPVPGPPALMPPNNFADEALYPSQRKYPSQEWADSIVPSTPQPIMSYTRIFDASEAELLAVLRDYVELHGTIRSGGYRGWLQRSDDFIRFCMHQMVTEMLQLHGGESLRRKIITYRRDHW